MNEYPKRFLELFAELEGGTVLDLGCGPPRPSTPNLRDRGLVSIDLEPGPGVDLVGDVGVVGGVPLPDECARLVLSSAVLEHVPDPRRAVDEAFRLLQPGGIAYVAPASMQPLHRAPGHFFGIYPDGLRHLLEGAGFVILDEGVEGSLADLLGWIRQDLLEMPATSSWEDLEDALRWIYETNVAAPTVLATGSWSVARRPE